MKKFILALLLLTAFTSLALGADIGYIVEDSPDYYVITQINSLGLSYDLILEDDIPEKNLSNYTILIVGDDNFDNLENIPIEQYKTLLINSDNYYKKGTLFPDYQFGWSTGKSSQSSPSSLIITNPNSSITDNLPEEFRSYTLSDPDIHTYYIKGRRPTNTKVIISPDGSSHSSSDSVLSVIYPNGIYLNDKVAEQRGVYFGIVHARYWTEESKTLFKNSIMWLINDEDLDNDGFLSDDDCNDNDAGINKNATEIAYDGIDQDCDGSDYDDLDEDGYSSTIVGGLDCDDNESSINPDNPNPYFNCLNDAPTFTISGKTFLQETETVELKITATDPEEDELNYSINGTMFNFSETNTTFIWETDYSDAGNYVFEINVSDYEFTTTKTITITIIEKNQPPLFNEIPNQTWEEDTNLTLNLSEYFYDLDGDNLTYGVFQTSLNKEILLNLTNDSANFTTTPNWNGQDWVIFWADDSITRIISNKIYLNVLPINDAPTTSPLGNKTLDEDEIYTVNLSDYFEDIDSELNFTFSEKKNISINISDGNLIFTPDKNWFGEENIIINATDGEFNLTNNISLYYLSINDAPEIINEEKLNSLFTNNFIDRTIDLTEFEFDAEESDLNLTWEVKEITGSVNVSIIDSTEDLLIINFLEKTCENCGVTLKLNDTSGKSTSKYFPIKLLRKIVINELLINSDASEWIELYNNYDQTINLSNCELIYDEGKIFNLSEILGKKELVVFEFNDSFNNNHDIINLICYDQLVDSVTYGSMGNIFPDAAPVPGLEESIGRSFGIDTDNDSADFKIFTLPTKNLKNNHDMILPIVTLLSPKNSTIRGARNTNFKFIVEDNMEELECAIKINGLTKDRKTIQSGIEEIFRIENLEDGNYTWTIYCSDQDNTVYANETRILEISAPDTPYFNSISDKSVLENEKLFFTITAIDPDGDTLTISVENLPVGAEFKDNGDNTAEFIWTPNYTQSGDYTIIATAKDTFGFSVSENILIKVIDKKAPPTFDDVNRCEFIDSNIKIEFDDPDEDDDFKFGETIKIELEISNDYDDNLNTEVEISLYDVTVEESLESDDDRIKIGKDDSETITFELKIPDDLDDNEFYLFAKVEDRKNESICNEVYIQINIEREDDDVIIKKMNFDKNKIAPNEELTIELEIKNIGLDEQENVYVVLENSELEIYEKSEKFDLEEYDESDTEKLEMTITIPNNASAKNYELKGTVYFGGDKSSKIESFTIEGELQTIPPIFQETSENEPILLTPKKSSSSSKSFSTANVETEYEIDTEYETTHFVEMKKEEKSSFIMTDFIKDGFMQSSLMNNIIPKTNLIIPIVLVLFILISIGVIIFVKRRK